MASVLQEDVTVDARENLALLVLLIHFVLLISRQGKVRLTKWYSPYSQKERAKVLRELSGMILTRGPKLCNFVEWRGYKVVYKRYASLYFCMCINQDDNELEILEIIHHYVEILDRYFGSVCELDLIFNFHKAYYILEEILLAGELQESSKKTVARLIGAQILHCVVYYGVAPQLFLNGFLQNVAYYYKINLNVVYVSVAGVCAVSVFISAIILKSSPALQMKIDYDQQQSGEWKS
ncbi:UNVERIFIED_CONTAM: AP-1 complex subunit sigma-2 [Sesamum indicum]